MKILVVTPTFLPIVGGAELGIYEIYKRLGRAHDVRILTPNLSNYLISEHGAQDTDYLNTNFGIHRFNDILNLAKIPGQRFFKGLIPPFSISYVIATFRNIKSFQPDVINFHYAIPGGLALILVRTLKKIPVVLSLVGRTDVLGNETPSFRRYYVWKVVKSASRVISNSRYNLRWPSGCKLGQIIPYGVDTERFSPTLDGEGMRRKLGIGRNKLVLFSLQRLVQVKRVDILIRALQHILEINKDMVLVIGGKGPEESRLRTLARELNVKDNVIFAGYIPEEQLPEYFAMADIFTFHSTYETFGIVLAQAMASGKPIVSTNTTAIPEVVDNGLNGILVEPLNPRRFAEAVIKLLDNRDLRKRYSENGRNKAVAEYDWDIIAQQYEQVFSNLIRDKTL